jgi:hypothetical protein
MEFDSFSNLFIISAIVDGEIYRYSFATLKFSGNRGKFEEASVQQCT